MQIFKKEQSLSLKVFLEASCLHLLSGCKQPGEQINSQVRRGKTTGSTYCLCMKPNPVLREQHVSSTAASFNMTLSRISLRGN